MLQNVQHITIITMEYFIHIKSIINIQLMDIALLLVVNCISDIIIDKTLCNYMIQLLYVYCGMLQLCILLSIHS